MDESRALEKEKKEVKFGFNPQLLNHESIEISVSPDEPQDLEANVRET